MDVTRGAILPLVDAGNTREIVLRDVRARGSALPQYELFLRDGRGRRASIGLLSFFNESVPQAPPAVDRRFAAAAALALLGDRPVAVELVPVSGLAGVAPTIASDARICIAGAELVGR